MGNRVNPLYFRVQRCKNWVSRWVSTKNYRNNIKEDYSIRKIIEDWVKEDKPWKVYVELLGRYTIINIFTDKPAVVIGKKGSNIRGIKDVIERRYEKIVFVNVRNITVKDSVVYNFFKALKIRMCNNIPYKKVIQGFIRVITERYKVIGVRVIISGRIRGSDIARREVYRNGVVPLSTIKSRIEYFQEKIGTKYGILGIKVWLNG